MVPESVIAAYEIDASWCVPIEVGLINKTFLVQAPNTSVPFGILQCLHPIFAAEVNLDIEAITKRLGNLGISTPRIIRTTSGSLWTSDSKDRTWRALTFVPGHTIEEISSPAQAHTAASLVANFHSALSDWDYEFEFSRPGAHDTAKHLARLETTLTTANSCGDEPVALELANSILEASTRLPTLPETPQRISHGDLKISNVRFASGAPPAALALIDLDTMGWQRLAYEIGDAMRSWCHRAREDERDPHFDASIFEAAITGYCSSRHRSISTTELESVVAGTETICIELAARFCQDVFDNSYFGWDSSRFESRQAHNLARAHSQLALAINVRKQAKKLLGIVRNAA